MYDIRIGGNINIGDLAGIMLNIAGDVERAYLRTLVASASFKLTQREYYRDQPGQIIRIAQECATMIAYYINIRDGFNMLAWLWNIAVDHDPKLTIASLVN